MKRIFLPVVLALALVPAAQAQKKVLDHSVYDDWQSLSNAAISPKGQVISYQVNPQEGDGTLYLRTLGKKGGECQVERGYKLQLSADEAYAVCLIKAPYAQTRQARIDKKKPDQMPKDSLAVIDLKTFRTVKYPDVKDYKMGKYAREYFAFSTTDTSFVPRQDRKAKDKGTPLAVYHFASGRLDTLQNIGNYAFSEDGEQLALVRNIGKNKAVAGFYSQGEAHFLTDTCAWVGLPVFDQDGARALFLQATDTLDSGSKHPKLYLYDTASRERILLIGENPGPKVPEGWGLTENSRLLFSHDGKRILAGIQAFEPPKDTTLVPFETPGLDIWNWDAPTLPPHDKLMLKEERTRTFLAVVKDGALIPLQTRPLARLNGGDRWDAPIAL